MNTNTDIVEKSNSTYIKSILFILQEINKNIIIYKNIHETLNEYKHPHH